MSGIFDSGRAEQLRSFELHGLTVSLFREGAAAMSDIPAKEGNSSFRFVDDYGVSVFYRAKDFIVRTSDLGDWRPKIGDEVHIGGKVYLVSVPNNEPCWRYRGNDEEQIRIHTKYMGPVENVENQ